MYSLNTISAAPRAVIATAPQTLLSMRTEIEAAAKVCRIPAEDFKRMVLLNAVREVQSTGQITVRAWPNQKT